MRLFILTLLLTMSAIISATFASDMPDKIYFMKSSSVVVAPAPAPTDPSLRQTDTPGVYSGVINIEINSPFGFYTGIPGTADTRYTLGASSAISFSQQDVWPDPEDAEQEEDARMKINSPSIFSWYVTVLPNRQLKQNMLVTVNLNSLTFSMREPEEENSEAEEFYFLASLNGGEDYQISHKLSESVSDDHVFELIYDVPDLVADKGGLRFFLSRTDTVSAGRITPAPEDAVVDFSKDATLYRSVWSEGETETVAIDLTPGLTHFLFNSSTMEMEIVYKSPNRYDDTRRLYVATYNGDNSAYTALVTPDENDRYLVYNETTGTYTGSISVDAYDLVENDEGGMTSVNEWIKFYTVAPDGTATFYGPLSTLNDVRMPKGTRLDFYSRALSLQSEFAAAPSSVDVGAWSVTDFSKKKSVAGTVNLEVDIESLTGIFTEIECVTSNAPTTIYFIYGTNGPYGAMKREKMTRDPENPDVYTFVMDVPECSYELNEDGFSPPEEDEDGTGMAFMMADTYSIGNKTTVYGGTVGDRIFDFAADETALSLPVVLGGDVFFDKTPGNTTFTLDIAERVLTLSFDVILPDTPDDDAAVESIGKENDEVVWYNLLGQKVSHPDSGIYIRVAGGKVSKVYFFRLSM